MLQECENYNCDELVDHVSLASQCLPPRKAGVSQIALVLCGAGLEDPSNGTEVAALIVSGQIKTILGLRFGFDSADQVTVDKITSCGTARVLHTTFSGTLKDWAWLQENMTLYTQLIGGYTVAGIIARQCPQPGWPDTSLWLNGEISFAGSPIVPDDDDDTARFELTWQFKGSVEIIPTPAGVFPN